MRNLLYIIIFILLNINSQAQQTDTLINMNPVHIAAERIELPFDAKSHSIDVINKEAISKMAASNVGDLLQNIVGVDVRRRGVNGAQSDISIRGGSFEQVLVLIDGFKVDDAQTGHHTMNLPVELSNIERIEVIKGPAARIYGLNAFGGAINIITKKSGKEETHLDLGYGSYNTVKIGLGFSTGEKVKQSFNFSKLVSDGYRHNTDLDNQNFNYNVAWGKKSRYQVLAAFSERKFGANGFYASPAFIDQYEETRTSLVGVQSRYILGNWIIKPKIYWRRNKDTYVFLRHNPDFFKNVHVTNKYASEVNGNYSSKLGTTGFGLEYSHTDIESNNLGDHNRNTIHFNLEHRFYFKQLRLDVTPGVSYTSVSDVNDFVLPGINLGFEVTKNLRAYANWGQTARIPTYTDLYYVGPTTLGNANLESEVASTVEGGLKFGYKGLNISAAVYQRDAENLIDWTKDNETDKWEARNFNNISALGIETSIGYKFPSIKFIDNLSIGYLYQDNKQNDVDVAYSRYAFNNIKNHVTGQLSLNLGKNVFTSMNYKYVDRANYKDYTVMDLRFGVKLKHVHLSIDAQNILDTEYQETNMVPMPGRNLMTQVKIIF